MSMTCNLVAITSDELRALVRNPNRVLDVFFPGDGTWPPAEHHLDLDKMWHGLHYLLTGTAWDGEPPFSLAILGGTEIGEDTGYGPPRYLTSEEVAQVAAALDETPHDAFMARFEPPAMNRAEVYSGGWEHCDSKYMREHLARLASFYRKAATDGRAVLICLS